MEGLTAKVFRTYNACHTFQIELKKRMENATTLTEKMVAYNEANRQVAILCNHQRSVSKAHIKTTEIALGTSKTNYIDPRISFAWSKKYNVPIHKVFNKSLQEKFQWASDVDADWVSKNFFF